MLPSEKLSWKVRALRRFESHLRKKGHLALLLPSVAAEFASSLSELGQLRNTSKKPCIPTVSSLLA